jgi:excisionase family DNA binding protein
MGVLSLLLKRAMAYPIGSAFSGTETTDPVKQHILNTHLLLSPNNILTPEEVAARLKVPESWVYEKTRARCRNPIPCLRLGRYIRFDWNAVIRWLTLEAEKDAHAKRPSLSPKRKLVR